MTYWRRTILASTMLGVLALVPHSSAFAGQYIDPSTLNPAAPPPYTCMATGGGAICRKTVTFVDKPAPSGLLCGSSQNPIELISADTGSQEATRYYDANLNMVRRVFHSEWVGTVTNPITGAYLGTRQRLNEVQSLTVPGDLSSIVFTYTGSNRFYLPNGGTVLLDVGREVAVDPDGPDVQASGQHPLAAYYGNGDTAAIEPICAALGAPQTS